MKTSFSFFRGVIITSFILVTTLVYSIAQVDSCSILFDDFEDGNYTQNPAWVDSSENSGSLSVVDVNGNNKFKVERVGMEWGFAATQANIGSDDFHLTYKVEGISSDSYDRGIIYFLDNSEKRAFSLVPDNWKDTLYIRAKEYNSQGEFTGNTQIAAKAYNGNDQLHTYELKREGNLYTALEDGIEICSGNYSNADQWHDDISRIMVAGRGSFDGSGVYYDDIAVSGSCTESQAIDISADSIFIGSIDSYSGDTSQNVIIRNTGEDTLSLDSIKGFNFPYSWNLHNGDGWPQKIAPTDSLVLTIVVTPDTIAGTYTDELRIYTPSTETSIVAKTTIRGLIAYYPFNGNANDETENNNDGTVYGATLTSDRFGNENSTYSFDGVDDYIQTPVNSNRLPISISVWFKSKANDKEMSIVDSDVGSKYGHSIIQGYDGYSSTSPDDTLDIQYHNGAMNTGVAIKPGIWYHVVALFENESVKAYINSELVSSKIFQQDPPDGSDFRFGRHNTFDYQWYEGFVDEVRLSSKVLAINEINALYANYHPPQKIIGKAGVQEIELKWSSDRISSLSQYNIFRDAVLIDSVKIESPADTSYLDTKLDAGRTYTYYITSADTLGNESQPSDTLRLSPNNAVLLSTNQVDFGASLSTTTIDTFGLWIKNNLPSNSLSIDSLSLPTLPFQTDTNSMNSILDAGDSTLVQILAERDTTAQIYSDTLILYTSEETTIVPLRLEILENNFSRTIDITDNITYSAASWVDFDNDSDLDLTVCGLKAGSPVTRLFKNDGNNQFEPLEGIALPDVYSGDLAWADYNLDGHLDLLISGFNGNENITRLYKNTGQLKFALVDGTNFPGLSESSLEWADLNNDGYKDIILAGNDGTTRLTKIYMNQKGKGFKEKTDADFVAIDQGDIEKVDFDNDSDWDIFITGYNGSIPVSLLYENRKDEGFQLAETPFDSLYQSDASWADYDADGDMDLILCGSDDSQSLTRLYQNDGQGHFTESNTGVFAQISKGAIDWGDYDNDGDYDLILAGYDGNQAIAKIYAQKSDHTFSEISDYQLSGSMNGTIQWSDYDGDQDLDVSITGSHSALMINDITTRDHAPTPPDHLQTTHDTTAVNLSWNPGSDDQTPSAGLYYNVLLSSQYGDSLWITPFEKATVPQINHPARMNDTSWHFTDLRPGWYYWSVQSLDPARQRSAFSNQDSIEVYTTPQYQASNLEVEDTTFYKTRLSWQRGNGDKSVVFIRKGNSDSLAFPQDSITYQANTILGLGDTLPAHGWHCMYKGIDTTVSVWGLEENVTYSAAVYESYGEEGSELYARDTSSNNLLTFTIPSRGQAQDLQVDSINTQKLGLSWKRGVGDSVVVLMKQGSAGYVFPKDSTSLAASSTFGQGDAVDTTLWYCVYNGPDTSVIVDGLTENNPYRIMVLEYAGVQGEETYHTDTTWNNIQTIYSPPILGKRFNMKLFSAWGDIDRDGDYDLFNSERSFYTNSHQENLSSSGEDTYHYFSIHPSSDSLIVKIELTGDYGGSYEQAHFYIDGDQIDSYVYGGSHTYHFSRNEIKEWIKDGEIEVFISNHSYVDYGENKVQITSFTNIGPLGDFTNTGTIDPISSYIQYNQSNQYFTTDTISNPYFSFKDITLHANAVGDYNNDGWQDVLVTGISNDSAATLLYKNNKGVLEKHDNSDQIKGLQYGDAEFFDYNRDQKLDVIITGAHDSSAATLIYTNQGSGMFTKSSKLTGLSYSSLATGDINQDGYPDILISGKDSSNTPIFSIYFNNTTGGFYKKPVTNITPVYNSAMDLGDLDNDGDLDLVILGNDGSNPTSLYYKNNGAGDFSRQSLELPAIEKDSSSWVGNVDLGDYDSDQDLDLLLSGKDSSGFGSQIIENYGTTPNTPPQSPDSLEASISDSTLLLNWQSGEDHETDTSSLTYNLMVLSSRGDTIVSPLASHNGYRYVSRPGNVRYNHSWKLNGLSEGTFLWTVQTIDAGLAGSPFAPMDTVVYDTSPPEIIDIQPDSGSISSDQQQKLSVVFSDSSAIDTSKLILKINDQKYSVSSPALDLTADTILFDPATIGLNYPQGKNTIKLDSLIDLGGNITSEQWNFYVDTLPPQTNHPFPSPDTILNAVLPNLSLEITDAIAGVYLNALKVIINEHQFSFSDSSVNYNNETDSLTLDWSETGLSFNHMDTISVQVTGQDNIDIGQANTFSRKWQFLYFNDLQAPAIDSIVPDSGQITSLNNQPIRIAYSDISPIDTTKLLFTVNGTSFRASDPALTPMADSIVFNPLTAGIQFRDDTNIIVLDSLVDLVGNKTSRQWQFLLDTVAPQTSNPVPQPDTLINGTPPELKLNIFDPIGKLDPQSIQVTINGNSYAFSHQALSYQQADNRLTFSWEDANVNLNHMDTISVQVTGQDSIDIGQANTFSRKWQFMYFNDLQAPAIDSIVPDSGQITSLTNQPIRIAYSDISPIDTTKLLFTVNGTSFRASDPALTPMADSIVFNPLTAGIQFRDDTNTIVLDSLVDLVGNKTSRQWQFLLDTVAPQTSNPVPQPDTLINGTPSELKLNIFDPIGKLDPQSIQVTINGNSFAFSHQALSYQQADNRLTFSWEDANVNLNHMDTISVQVTGQDSIDIGQANTFSRKWQFMYFNDLQAPEIKSIVPDSGQITSLTNQPIRIAYSDISPIDTTKLLFTVNGTSFRASHTALNISTDSIVFNPLTAGVQFRDDTNTIVLDSLVDLVGNKTSRQWQFLLDTVAPQTSNPVPQPDTLINGTPPELKLNIFDPIGKLDPQSIQVTINGNNFAFSHQALSYQQADNRLTFSWEDANVNLNHMDTISVQVTGQDNIDIGQANTFSRKWQFMYFNDLQAPEIISIVPDSGQITSLTNQPIRIAYSDISPIDTTKLLFTVNGTSFRASHTALNISTDSIVFNPLTAGVQFRDDTNTIVLDSLVDLVGNKTSRQWQFLLDTVMPVATYPSPTHESLVYNEQPTLSLVIKDRIGRVDTSSLEMELNGITYSLTNGDMFFDEVENTLTLDCEQTDVTFEHLEKVSATARGQDITDLGKPNTFEYQWNFTIITKGYLEVQVNNASGNFLSEAEVLIQGDVSNDLITSDQGFLRTDLKIDSYEITAIKPYYFALKKNNVNIKGMDTSRVQFQLGALGDYNANGVVNYEDVDAFIEAYNQQIDSIEYGPASGSYPNFKVEPDEKLDFEDLMVLSMIWPLHNDETEIKTADLLGAKSTNKELQVSYRKNGNKIQYQLFGSRIIEYRSARVIINYDPKALKFLGLQNKRENAGLQNAISLLRKNEQEGLIELCHAVPGFDHNLNDDLLSALKFLRRGSNAHDPKFYYEMRNNLGDVYKGNADIEEITTPKKLKLSCYPNPVRQGHLRLHFSLPEEGKIHIDLLDHTGSVQSHLVKGMYPAGEHNYQQNLSGISTGIYFVRLRYRSEQIIVKCMITQP